MSIDFNKAIKIIEKALMPKLELAGAYVVTETAYRCPVLTGNLRDSYFYKILEDGLTVRVGTTVDYAPHVEFGTEKQMKQPHLRPAVFENENNIIKLLQL